MQQHPGKHIMETRKIEVTSNSNKNVKLGLIPGHFATNHSHVNYFVDMTTIKTEYRAARETARELAKAYAHSQQIDTIICLEGTEMIGAFLARDLCENGNGINGGLNISVVTPETNMNNQMIFRDNIQKKVYNKNILLLMASVSTGKSISRCMDCLQYYYGKLVGVSAIFSAIEEYNGVTINAAFNKDDIPEYKSSLQHECPLCAAGTRVDAIVNSFGYSKI